MRPVHLECDAERCAPTAETVTFQNLSNMAFRASVQTLHTDDLASLEHFASGHARLRSFPWKVLKVG